MGIIPIGKLFVGHALDTGHHVDAIDLTAGGKLLHIMEISGRNQYQRVHRLFYL